MFWTGFALYVAIVASAPEVAPTINSPISNLFWCVTNKREPSSMSSTNTVAVAPEVEPVTVSPFIKSPTAESSKRILSPVSSFCWFVPFNNKKLSVVVWVSNRITSGLPILEKTISADSKNL